MDRAVTVPRYLVDLGQLGTQLGTCNPLGLLSNNLLSLLSLVLLNRDMSKREYRKAEGQTGETHRIKVFRAQLGTLMKILFRAIISNTCYCFGAGDKTPGTGDSEPISEVGGGYHKPIKSDDYGE
jgi:hypothetical protein